MNLVVNTPKKSLNKAFLKQRTLRSEINLFKQNLNTLLNNVDEIETEENQKTHIRDFLLNTYYKNEYEINTKDNKDLVIHLGKTNKSNVGVIIETKRPSNRTEMISENKLNCKALHEIILYYFDERENEKNNELKHLIITNVYEWFIFDANSFDKVIYRNTAIKHLYNTYINDNKDTGFFYAEVGKIISSIEHDLNCVYFDIRNYKEILEDSALNEDKKLIALQKILSPTFILKQSFANDSNSLNQNFYKELLYIIGLEEIKEKGKHIIRRKENNRQTGSLIENTINILNVEDTLYHLPDKSAFGDNKEEQLFNIALELSLTWINRILFLKLLEGLLLTYHQGNKDYVFLNSDVIQGYDELYKLFHQVLAVSINDRNASNKKKFKYVPYLNSSLFEISDLEHKTIRINSLDDSASIELINTTILKKDKQNKSKLLPLDYLFKFLDAYDFSSEGGEDIAEDNKTIINASVLGLIFEKINGYKDGSFFTPSFITMYMSRQALRLAVVQKFNDYFKNNNLPEVKEFDELYNAIARMDINISNDIINSLRICDPAVGSGHFLVSVLNELIAIKSELGILADKNGKLLKDYEIIVENDDLIISDENGFFEYHYKNKESQRVQEAIFNEKQTLIENCLFGVDINPNSVKICRLRLWIELLKSSYYKNSSTNSPELETLPNIDINIKIGNSLISRFSLDADLSKALKSIKYDIDTYRGFVAEYKNEKNREVKRGLEKIIDSIKSDFRTEINKNDPKIRRLNKATAELYDMLSQEAMFQLNKKEQKQIESKKEKLEKEIDKLTKEIEEIKSNAIYKNAFEWRFEFPEVLNANGDFIGFDVVIGNPPYIQLQTMNKVADTLSKIEYMTFAKTGDIYTLFYEKSNQLMKNKAHLAFITSNKWMRAAYGEKLRNYFASFTNPKILIDLGPNIFEEATVDTNIMIFQKEKNQNKTLACTIAQDFKKTMNIREYLNENKVELNNLTKDSWIILSPAEQSIKKKIEEIGTPLKDWDINIYRGVLTGYNKAFIIDGKKKDELIAEDPKSAEIIKPILRGRDIKRYRADFADLWLIMIPKGFTIKTILNENQNNKTGIVSEPIPRYGYVNYKRAWKFMKDNYPAIANHLIKYKLKAEKRQDQGDYWWEMRACAYIEEFEKEKIVYPNMSSEFIAYFDNNNYLTNQKCFIITGNYLKFLTALLNSKVNNFYFRQIGAKLGDKGMEMSKIFVIKIPIPQLSKSEQEPFEELADKIIEAKSKDPEADTNHWERAIDKLVYNLYGLTEEEIKIVEGE